MPFHRCRCRHFRPDEMSSSTLSLAAFKVSIGSGSATISRFENVVVHCKTHGTTWVSPLKAGRDKDLIQTFLFRLAFDSSRTWNHDRLNLGRNFFSLDSCSRSSQIFDSGIGAGTDKTLLILISSIFSPGFKSIYLRADSIPILSIGSVASSGLGTVPFTETT